MIHLSTRPTAVLCCALEEEYQGILHSFPGAQALEDPYDLHVSLLQDGASCLLILCSGVGRRRAQDTLHLLVQNVDDVRMVFSCGIAGILDETHGVGDVIVSQEVWSHSGGQIRRMGECPAPPPSVQKALREQNAAPMWQGRPAALDFGAVLTSDQPVADQSLARTLYRKTGALCVEMEAAGVASLCRERGIPFLSVKIMSDYADQSALISMLRNYKQLSSNLGIFLQSLWKGMTAL